LAVAAVNGPQETVVSGELGAVAEVLEEFSRQGVKTRRLTVSHAFHSPLMDPMLAEFERIASQIHYASPRLKLVSNLTGQPVKGSVVGEAGYWRRHVREPVLFAQGMQALRALDVGVFVEIGPRPVLLGMGERCLPEGRVWLPSLRNGRDDWQQMLESLGGLYTHGVPVDWRGFDKGRNRHRVTLPTYPFQRERYWVEASPAPVSQTPASPAPTALETRPEETEATPAQAELPPLARRLQQAAPVRRRELLFAHVQEEVRHVLRVESSQPLDPRQGFFELGMDSLMSVELKRRLEASLGRALPQTLAFDHPTVEALTDHLARELLALDHAATGAALARPGRRASVDEPIAVVGMSCRLPGGANTPEDFWELLRDGRDAMSEVPRDRWDIDAYYDRDPDAPGKMYVRSAGFLQGMPVDRFDAAFFGISPREVLSMDPQQRMLLEVSWEALEDAGQVPSQLVGTRTGVFVGIASNDYSLRVISPDSTEMDPYAGTGNSYSVAAGRVSYVLGLRGPAMSVDTACSSSLVTLHLACQSLRSGESDLALAGGVNLMLAPWTSVYFCKLRALAADGRCKTFDASADGYARGEGCGMVVLKRLSDALRDGDNVLAVVRGTAVNHDGRSSGLTVPNGASQQAVIREALASADVAPAEVGYVEAHGTGTALGDPIEAQALVAVMGEGRTAEQPLFLGSAKTNVGHLEAAAGAAGIIKVVQSLRHGEIPAHLHFKSLNPAISWGTTRVVIPTQRTPWPSTRRRIAGISSFGMSGTNAHAVLESFEASAPAPEREARVDPVHLLPLSARTPEALRELAQSFHALLSEPEGASLKDLCYTAAVRRQHHEHRLAVVGHSRRELAERIEAFLQGARAPGLTVGEAQRHEQRLVFVLPATGELAYGLGRKLLRDEPPFRAAFEQCDAVLRPLIGASVKHELEAEPSRLEQPEVARPVLFAVQVALAALWRAAGFEPQAVVGSGAGQLAAAHVAGVLSLEDAARALCLRSAEGVTSRPAAVPLCSPVTGGELGTEFDPAAWAREGVEAALSAEAIQRMAEEGHTLFLELSPHPVHLTAIETALRTLGKDGLALPSLRRDQEEGVTLLSSVAALHVRGYPVDWRKLHASGGRPVRLPRYPWQRQRYWIEAPHEKSAASGGGKAPGLEDWMYGLEWQPRALTPPAGEPPRRTWLVLQDGTGVGRALAARLEALGDTCVEVTRGESFARGGPGRWSVDPSRPEHFEALVAETLGTPPNHPVIAPDHLTLSLRERAGVRVPRGNSAQEPITACGVVNLWALDSPPADSASEAALGSAQAVSCGSVLHLLQALTKAGVKDARLWGVTRGAQPAGTGEVPLSVVQAPVWGLGRVAALEYPELWGGLVDLPPTPEADETERLAQELRTPDGEDQVALRGTHRYVARLVKSQPSKASAQPLMLHAEATYLVTGGLGALGLKLARWLVEHGARRLVLTGRTALPERSRWDELPEGDSARSTVAALRELEAQGAEVRVARADVADAARMEEVLGEVRGSLRGILHAAGVSEPLSLQETKLEALLSGLRAKVTGTWVLHRLTRDVPLDFFVSFSSVAAVWGSANSATYAAANHFLDAVAHHRRALGLPALSICWGGWEGGGMVSAEAQAYFEQIGLGFMPAAQALQAMERLLSAGPATGPQAVVAAVDWGRYKPVFEARRRRPLLEKMAAAPAAGQAGPAVKATEFTRQLEQAEPARRGELLLAHVSETVAKVLGRHPSEPLPLQRGFFELGMDSLMSVDLQRRLQTSLGCSLPPTVAFEHSTVEALTKHLSGLVLPASSASVEPAPSQKVRPAPAPSSEGLEPIAIIGMDCRLPGGDSPERFWEVLQGGVDATSEVPADRWNIAHYYDPSPDAPGKMYVYRGGFLKDVDRFDARFFNLSPREAALMDPQHRLLLEVSWQALERAGYAPGSLSGSRTGVFLGLSNNDYALLHPGHTDPSRLEAHVATSTLTFAAGRLSYHLGLQGPSMVLDTACSSSLVATHLACQSLRSGESDLALAGGFNLILAPTPQVVLCKARMLSPDGRCKTFDASADGYARGEGGAVLVLKRLSDALRDGDSVLAVLRGSAVNQDGPSSGITVPNGLAQQALIREALAQACVAPAEVGYVEAHGTGTSLGDPIEVRALGAVLSEGRAEGQKVAVGSVKTNIGHLEAAAGAAGLVKAVLSLQHEEIPPHLHLKQPNPRVDWDALPVYVPTARTPWKRGGHRRVVGVSSFGASGTNAHVVLEEAPLPADAGVPQEPERPFHLLTLSARTAPALEALVSRFVEHLEARPDEPLADLCHTVNVGRSHFEHRLAVVAGTGAQLRERLAEVARGQTAPGTQRGHVQRTQPPKVAFLFTGQGSQYAGMGRGLYEVEPVFREALDRCDALLRPHLEKPLLAVMFAQGEPEALIHETGYAQPALFALQYALAELWKSWGITPSWVMGHSVGEYAAACVAGVFSLEEGLRLIAARGRGMQALPREQGAMAAIFAEEARVTEALAPFTGRLSVAAINGPTETVISGEREAVEAVLAGFAEQGVKAQRLTVSHAFHSPLLAPMLDAFTEVAAGVKYRPPRLPLISNLTGEPVRGEEAMSASYWRRHMMEPVRFMAGVQALRGQGAELFVELGPQPTLLGLARRCVPEQAEGWLPSLRKGHPDAETLLRSLGALYVEGAAVDWKALDGGRPRRKRPLPTYPFERQRHWLDTTPGLARRARAAGASAEAASALGRDIHPLLGQHIPSPVEQVLIQSCFRTEALPLFRDHRVYGANVVSGVIHLALATAAARRRFGAGTPLEFEDIAFTRPLLLMEDESRDVQLVLQPEGPEAATFEFFSRDDADSRVPWTSHTRGRVRRQAKATGGSEVSLEALRARLGEALSGEDFYRRFWKLDEHFIGPSFQRVEALWRGEGEALARLKPAEFTSTEGAREEAEAALIEACGQVLKAALPGEEGDAVYIGVGVERHRQLTGGVSDIRWCHARLRPERARGQEFRGDLWLLDAEGRVLAVSEGFRFQRVEREVLRLAIQRAKVGQRASQAGVSREQLLAAEPAERRRLLEGYLRRQLARMFGLAPEALELQASLRSLGMDSLMAGELQGGFTLDLGVELPAVELLQGPSVAELTERLARLLERTEPSAAPPPPAAGGSSAAWVVIPRPNPSARLRLFCLPYGGGGASAFRTWADGLPSGVEVCAIQLPGREERLQEAPIDRLEPLVEALVPGLLPYLDRPFAFFGCSMGALLGFELARYLRRHHGRGPSHLFAAAFTAPHLPNTLLGRIDERLFDVDASGAELERLASGGFLPEPLLRSEAMRRALLPVLGADFRVVRGYAYREEEPLDCPISALGGQRDRDVPRSELAAWFEHTRSAFRLHMFPGAHLFMESDREELLRVLSAELAPLL
jgi:acyl transferase domain-containing protein/surfactin synthase thioesterase subunit